MNIPDPHHWFQTYHILSVFKDAGGDYDSHYILGWDQMNYLGIEWGHLIHRSQSTVSTTHAIKLVQIQDIDGLCPRGDKVLVDFNLGSRKHEVFYLGVQSFKAL